MLDGITFIPYILWNNIGRVSLSSPRVRLSSNILATSTSMKLVRHGYKRSRVAHSWAARGGQNPSRRHHYSIHRFPPRRHRRWHSEQPEEAIDKGGRGAISSFMWCGRVGVDLASGWGRTMARGRSGQCPMVASTSCSNGGPGGGLSARR
jgi:hypothetical protein